MVGGPPPGPGSFGPPGTPQVGGPEPDGSLPLPDPLGVDIRRCRCHKSHFPLCLTCFKSIAQGQLGKRLRELTGTSPPLTKNNVTGYRLLQGIVIAISIHNVGSTVRYRPRVAHSVFPLHLPGQRSRYGLCSGWRGQRQPAVRGGTGARPAGSMRPFPPEYHGA
jgi:hypothetical protein